MAGIRCRTPSPLVLPRNYEGEYGERDFQVTRARACARLISNLTRSALGGLSPLESAADTREVLQQEERERVPPVLYLDGETDLATDGVPGHSTKEEELAILQEKEITHAPVIRWTVRDCLIHRHGVEARAAALRFARPELSILADNAVQVDQAFYANTGSTVTFFGHWLRDGCSSALLRDPNDILALDSRQGWSDVPFYLRSFGLAPTPARLLFAKRLTFLSDYSQGSSKRARYTQMRKALEQALPGTLPSARNVFFRRGSTGAARIIDNESELLSALERRGFETVDLATSSVQDIIQRFRGAQTVISVDGSHLNHLYLALPPGACLLTIIPADRFTMAQASYANGARLRYGFCVMERRGSDGYVVDIERLHALLDMAQA